MENDFLGKNFENSDSDVVRFKFFPFVFFLWSVCLFNFFLTKIIRIREYSWNQIYLIHSFFWHWRLMMINCQKWSCFKLFDNKLNWHLYCSVFVWNQKDFCFYFDLISILKKIFQLHFNHFQNFWLFKFSTFLDSLFVVWCGVMAGGGCQKIEFFFDTKSICLCVCRMQVIHVCVCDWRGEMIF